VKVVYKSHPGLLSWFRVPHPHVTWTLGPKTWLSLSNFAASQMLDSGYIGGPRSGQSLQETQDGSLARPNVVGLDIGLGPPHGPTAAQVQMQLFAQRTTASSSEIV